MKNCDGFSVWNVDFKSYNARKGFRSVLTLSVLIENNKKKSELLLNAMTLDIHFSSLNMDIEDFDKMSLV